MVRLIDKEEIPKVAVLMKAMAKELMGDSATDDVAVYVKAVFDAYKDKTQHIYVDDNYKGFFILKDDYEEIYPDYHRYIMTKIYIKPEARKGTLYRDMYLKVVEDFPTGDILGVTEIDSQHIPILEKRHKRIANVYQLDRNYLKLRKNII